MVIIFDCYDYYDKRNAFQEEFQSEKPDEDFDESLHLIEELSPDQEQTLYFGVMDTLHIYKVFQQGDGSIRRFRPHIPRLFWKFLDDLELDISSQEMLDIFLEVINLNLDDFLTQICRQPIRKRDEEVEEDEDADFSHYIVEMYCRFLLHENKLQKKADQQRIFLLLKDKGEDVMKNKFWDSKPLLEARGKLNEGICGCGLPNTVQDFDNVDHLKCKQHRDTLFQVCQYLFKVSDIDHLLSKTCLYTIDKSKSIIDLIMSFYCDDPDRVQNDPWGQYRYWLGLKTGQ